LLYAKSKYFPKALQGKTAFLRRTPWMTRAFSYGLMLVALWRLIDVFGGFTGTLFWLNALILAFGALIISLPLAYKS